MRIKNLTCAILFAMALFTSCNEIDESERLIYVQPAEVNRAVLIEDFTGQACVNCPKATDEIHALQQQYGEENVIAVAIHSGPFSKRGSRPYSLWTAEGDEYYSHWNVPAQPNGMVNRHSVSNYPEWGSLVRQCLQQTTTINLKGNAKYNANDSSVTVTVDVTNTGETYDGKLQLWLTEDNIIDLQSLPDGSKKEDYVHNHVFRTAINGTWGETMSISNGKTTQLKGTCTLKEGWNAQNISVVAFAYNDDKGVEQVIKMKVAVEK